MIFKLFIFPKVDSTCIHQRNKNLNIMARPTNNDPVEIKRLLDIGVNERIPIILSKKLN